MPTRSVSIVSPLVVTTFETTPFERTNSRTSSPKCRWTPSVRAASCSSSPAASSSMRRRKRGPRMSQCVSTPREHERLGKLVGDERAADRDGDLRRLERLRDRHGLVTCTGSCRRSARPRRPATAAGFGRPPVASSSASHGSSFPAASHGLLCDVDASTRVADAGRCAVLLVPRDVAHDHLLLGDLLAAASAAARCGCRDSTVRRRTGRSNRSGPPCGAAPRRWFRQSRFRR